jgi:hypothetical protein
MLKVTFHQRGKEHNARAGLEKAGMDKPHFKVELFLAQFDIWLHSYFIAGMVQLANEGAITLRVMGGQDRRRCLAWQKKEFPLLTIKCTDVRRNHSRIICFDPKDQSNAWQTQALEGCDVYYKRSTHRPDTECLTQSQQSKVHSINPMFATWCSGAGTWNARLSAAMVAMAGHEIGTGMPPRKSVNTMLRQLRIFAFLSTLDEYEDTPADNKRKQVLFQTRLWDPAEEEGDWVEECNLHRVEMVRVLRRRLGDRCVGGLIRTPFTEKHYPELMSNLTANAKAKRPEFIRLCRQFLVRVNIKALFDAVPYSLGETLAANNCLVSEDIRNGFATPLVEGEHYAGFTTPDECADRCEELLDADDKANRLRAAAYAYYCNAVRPKEAMRTFLKQAMS